MILASNELIGQNPTAGVLFGHDSRNQSIELGGTNGIQYQ
jgi:hypothetical protein